MSFSSTAPKPLTSRSFQILSDCIIYEFEKIFLKAEEGSRDYEKKDALQKEYDRFKSWVTGHAVSVDGAPSLQARVQKHEEKVIRKLGIEDGIHESLKSIITHLRILSEKLPDSCETQPNADQEYEKSLASIEGMDGIKEGLDIFRSHLLFATIGGLIRGLRHSIDQLEIHTENLNPPMLKDFGHSILEKLEQLILKAKKSPEQLSHGSQETDPTDEVIIKSFEDDMERYKKNHESDSCDRKQLEELEGRYWVFFLEIFKFQRARFQMWAKMVLLFESSKNSLDQKMQESDPIFNHGYQTSFRDIFREICDALKEIEAMSLKGSVSSDEAETNKEEMYDSEDEMRPNEVKDCLADLVDSLHYEIFSLYRTTKALRLL